MSAASAGRSQQGHREAGGAEEPGRAGETARAGVHRFDRRRLLISAAAVVAAPMLNLGRARLFGAEYSTRALDLIGENLVIDMLSPLTLNDEVAARWGTDGAQFSAADAAEFRSSGIDVFHVAVGIGGATQQQAFDDSLAFVAGHDAWVANRPDVCMRIDSVDDLDRVHGSGRIGVLIGTQSADQFRSPDDVDLFYALGQRVAQLTYNRRNLIGNGSTERVDGGISDFGASIIERMNKAGMAVDTSHCGDRTTLDAFELSARPVLITHSNCRALCPGHPRCKTDEAIRAMAAKGGVMGITGVRMFVKREEPTTVEDYLDHFDHVKALVGPEHLGIGSDMDLHGYDALPEELGRQLRAAYKDSYGFRERIDIEGIDHPRRVYDLVEGLIRRRYTEAEIRGILGANFRRVLGEIWSG